MTTRNQEIDSALKSHDKAITEIQATLSALSKQQEAILKAVTEKTGSGSGEGGGSGSAFNTNGADSRNNRSLRIGKIDFPMFSGDDVEGWVYHCEQLFAMDETPEGMKLRYAVVHLEGDALQWHQAYLRTRNATDPLEELASLNQTGTLHDLNMAFDALLNKVNLTESQAISLYLKALSPDIRGMVKMFRSRTLHEAYGLAKTQALNNESLEEKINKDKGNSGNTRNYINFNITPPVNASKLPLLPTPKPTKTTFTEPNGGPRHLTSKELEYKSLNGRERTPDFDTCVDGSSLILNYAGIRLRGCSGSAVSFNPGPVVLLWCCWVVVPQVVFACGSLELFAGLWFCYISGFVNLFDEVLVVPRFHKSVPWLVVFLAPLWGSGFRVVAQVWCLLRLFASDVVLGLAPWLLLQRPCWIVIVLRYQFCLLVLLFFSIGFCLFGFSLDCKFGCLFGVVVFVQVRTSAFYPSMAILRFHYPFAGLNECHDGGVGLPRRI
nr:hypothetical protein [Tanacetum cinerariifolium]